MYNYALYTTNNNNIKAVELIAVNPNTFTFKTPIDEEYFLYSIFIGGSQSGVDVVSYEQNGLEPHYFQLSVLNDTDITFDTEIDQNYFYPAGQNLFFKTRYNLSAEQCAINLLRRDFNKQLKIISSKLILDFKPVSYDQWTISQVTSLESLSVKNLIHLPFIKFEFPNDFDYLTNPIVYLKFFINNVIVYEKSYDYSIHHIVKIYGRNIEFGGSNLDIILLTDSIFFLTQYIVFYLDDLGYSNQGVSAIESNLGNLRINNCV